MLSRRVLCFSLAMLFLVVSSTDCFGGGLRRWRARRHCHQRACYAAPAPAPPQEDIVKEVRIVWVCHWKRKCNVSGNPVIAAGQGDTMAQAEQAAQDNAYDYAEQWCPYGHVDGGKYGECRQYTVVVGFSAATAKALQPLYYELYEGVITSYCCDGRTLRVSSFAPSPQEAYEQAKTLSRDLAKEEGCVVRCCSGFVRLAKW